MVELGPARHQQVLAILGLATGAPVAIDTLIARIWGEDPPPNARGSLYAYISRLRSALRTAGIALTRAGNGYALPITREQVDVHRFRHLIERVRATPAQELRRALLAEALGLWRDTPLTGLTGDWADAIRTELERLRLSALADRIDIDLTLAPADSTGILDELAELVREHTLDERFAAQLIRALHANGMRREALACFARTRDRLADELGVQPGAELTTLHRQLARDEPLGHASASAQPPVPRQLPAAPTTFTGRDVELAQATDVLIGPHNGPRVVVIHGPAGVGKSALALCAAHAAAEHYPAGQLYVDLHGFSPGQPPLSVIEVLGRILRALGVPPASVSQDPEEAATQYRSVLAGRKVLLVLDNATNASQVDPLLPSHPETAMIITSRPAIVGMDDALRIGLRSLTPEQAVDLLARLDPRARSDPRAARELAALGEHLPLALRIIAARMLARPAWPVAGLIERLVDHRRRLDELGHAGVSVRAAFDAGREALHRSDDDADHAASDVFPLLALPDGADISTPIIARLLDTTPADAERRADRLADAQLVESHAPGRYRMHDLVRLYARQAAEHEVSQEKRWASLARTWRCYLATTVAANQLVRPGYRKDLVKATPDEALPLHSREHATAWLDAERMNIVSAAEQAAEAPDEFAPIAVQLAHAMFDSLHTGRHWTHLRALNERALAVARRYGDRHGEGQVLTDLGVTAWLSGEGERAVELFNESLTLRRMIGDRPGEATSLHNLATACSERGRYDDAIGYAEQALRIRRDLGDPSGQGRAMGTLAQIHRHRGRPAAAIPLLRESLDLFRELGDERSVAHSLDDLGSALTDTGRLDEAVDCHRDALAINRELGAQLGMSWNLVGLGEAYRRRGQPADAVRACSDALTIARDINAQHEEGRALWRLGCALDDLGDADGARARWREALPILERLGAGEASDVRYLLFPP